MTAVDPAALRELAQGLTVPDLQLTDTGTIVAAPGADDRDQSWIATLISWVPLFAADEKATWELEQLGARVTHIPMPVDQLTAVREALEGAAAELGRLRAGLARLRKTPCDGCDAAEVAHNLLAETEGESRG